MSTYTYEITPFVYSGVGLGLIIASFFLTFLTWIVYYLIFRSHLKDLSFDLNLQISTLRLALFFPLYTSIFLLGFLLPECWPIFEVFESILEGFIILEYFKLIVNAIGGWTACVNGNYCSHTFLRTVYIFVLSLLVLRPICFIIKALIENYSKAIATLMQAITAVIMIVAMVFLIRLYKSLHHSILFIKPTQKFLFIKISILIIIIENVIINALAEHADSSNRALTVNQVRRLGSFIILVEMFIGSLLSIKAFDVPTKPTNGPDHEGEMGKLTVTSTVDTTHFTLLKSVLAKTVTYV